MLTYAHKLSRQAWHAKHHPIVRAVGLSPARQGPGIGCRAPKLW